MSKNKKERNEKFNKRKEKKLFSTQSYIQKFCKNLFNFKKEKKNKKAVGIRKYLNFLQH